MRAFLWRRLGALLVALGVASVAVFLLVRLVPGDPARLLLKNPTPEKVAELRARLALDRPLAVQYWLWLKSGNLGESVVSGRPVSADLARTWPATVELAVAAMVVATLGGVWLGIFAARHAGRWPDVVASAVGLVGLSVPVFWLGLLAMLLFALQLGWFPAGDRGTWRHLVLPACVLATIPGAFIMRVTRAAVLETLGKDFIRTARAKGAGERSVLYRHALRAALVPVVTMIGVEFAYLLGGAVLTETVFAWPGIGRYIATAVLSRDYPAIQGALLVLVAMVMLVNFLVDVLQHVLDPRLRV
ncbi:MAG: Glutathione transport system permease protein GsiC [Verrucomicrobiae bacterium]|nr:Glutathione transport system permease protein GsiC [Verrucomicrobiae bacterium]